MQSLDQETKLSTIWDTQTKLGSIATLPEDQELSLEEPFGEENQGSSDHSSKGTSSPFTIASNIINTCIGGGILGFPYVIRQLGIVIGILLVVTGGALACFSTVILQKTKNLSRRCDYMGVAEAALNRFGRIVSAILIIISTLGACVVFLVVLTAVMQNILEEFIPACASSQEGQAPLYCRQSLITTFGAAMVLPFNFLKDLSKLKVAGILKVVSIVTFTGITIGSALHRTVTGTLASEVDLSANISEPVAMLATIPQLINGFNYMFNQFPLYKTMKDPSDSRFNKAAILSLTFVGLVYIVVGVCGYLVYGSATDNLLRNFKREDLGYVWFFMLNFAFLVASLTGIPVNFFPARDILFKTITNGMGRIKNPSNYTTVADDLNTSSHSKASTNRGVYITIVLFSNALMVLVAIMAPGLNPILGLFGALGGAGLMFVFPMVFYLRLSHGLAKHKVFAVIVLIFGVLVGIGGFVTNLMKMMPV